MSLPNSDPSLPSNPAPLFQDNSFVRGDQQRANNQAIWGNLEYLELTKALLAGSISQDFAAKILNLVTLNITGQIVSTLATGTPPLVVASTTQVSNLTAENADKVDGLHGSDILQATTMYAKTIGVARVDGVTYTNTSGRAMIFFVYFAVNAGRYVLTNVAGRIQYYYNDTGAGRNDSMLRIVLPGETFQFGYDGPGGGNSVTWYESQNVF